MLLLFCLFVCLLFSSFSSSVWSVCVWSVVRLVIWAFVGVPSLRQIYSYLSDPRCKRIGHQTFLCLIILLTELILIVKFGQGEFPKPMTQSVKHGLVVFLSIYALILVFLALRAPRATQGEETPRVETRTIKAQ